MNNNDSSDSRTILHPEAEKELLYLRRCCERTATRVLELDAQCVALRQELEQKRRGFSLMAELAVDLGRDSDYRGVFVSVSRRINAALNMQRTMVLLPESDGTFTPSVMQGYTQDEQDQLEGKNICITSELLQNRTVLVTGADDPARLAQFREAVGLPFFISAPVILHGDAVALLVTGRLAEELPYLTRLGKSDEESVQTVAAYLAAMMAASRLVEAEDLTQIMLDATPLCCGFWDEQFCGVACNQEAVRLFGLKDKKEYLERFYELSPPHQPDGRLSAILARERMREALSTGWLRFEWVHQKLNGEPIPVEVTLVRVRRGEGFNIAGYTRDLRAHKAMLAEMREAENELRLARDMADQITKAKNQFVSNISHEIRTPINAVFGMLHLLDGTALTDKQRQWLRQAERSASLLLHVIDDLLDYSKIEAGRLQIDYSRFSLHTLLDTVSTMVRRQAEEKGLKFFAVCEPDVPDLLLGDPLRLEQVLLNLTNNAIKFTQAGSVGAHVGVKSLQNGEVTLLFEVKDTGIGLTAQQAAGLFVPFSPGDSSLTRRYSGAGLGLAISQSVVEIMGGSIWCESEPGEGSKFSFTATFGLGNTQEAESESPALPLPGTEGPPEDNEPVDFAKLRGLRVLLAEDNTVNQLIVAEMLGDKGVEVLVASNGKEAVSAVCDAAFDLVLMDIQMPEMDGLTATGEIRKIPACAGLPIIAMTAHAMTGDREMSISSGMNDHLTKPIAPQLLYKALIRWSGR